MNWWLFSDYERVLRISYELPATTRPPALRPWNWISNSLVTPIKRTNVARHPCFTLYLHTKLYFCIYWCMNEFIRRSAYSVWNWTLIANQHFKWIRYFSVVILKILLMKLKHSDFYFMFKQKLIKKLLQLNFIAFKIPLMYKI